MADVGIRRVDFYLELMMSWKNDWITLAVLVSWMLP